MTIYSRGRNTRALIQEYGMKKHSLEYGTIQIEKILQKQIVEFCNLKGYKIRGYIEQLFLANVSGSEFHHKITTKRA